MALTILTYKVLVLQVQTLQALALQALALQVLAPKAILGLKEAQISWAMNAIHMMVCSAHIDSFW